MNKNSASQMQKILLGSRNICYHGKLLFWRNHRPNELRKNVQCRRQEWSKQCWHLANCLNPPILYLDIVLGRWPNDPHLFCGYCDWSYPRLSWASGILVGFCKNEWRLKEVPDPIGLRFIDIGNPKGMEWQRGVLGLDVKGFVCVL